VEKYLVECWNCAATYDAVDAVLCNHSEPTTVCPFCLKCFCEADEEFRSRFWKECPQCLRERRKKALNHRNPLLGEMLVQSGKVSREELKEAMDKQAFIRKPLGEILVMMDALTIDELQLFLADQKLVDRIDLTGFKLDPDLIARLGATSCVVHRMVPIELCNLADGEILRFAVQAAEHIPAIKRSRVLSHFRLIPYLAEPEQFEPLFKEITDLSRGKGGRSGD